MFKWFDNIKESFYQKRLHRTVAEVKVRRHEVNFENTKTIGLLIEAGNRENLVFADKYREKLRKTRKQVKILAYFNDKANHDNLTVNYFTNKDMNWYGIPNSEQVRDFIDRPFDVLISLHLTPSRPLEFISTISNAKMRVGLHSKDKEYCYDFMIDPTEVSTLSQFIDQFEDYFKIINVHV